MNFHGSGLGIDGGNDFGICCASSLERSILGDIVPKDRDLLNSVLDCFAVNTIRTVNAIPGVNPLDTSKYWGVLVEKVEGVDGERTVFLDDTGLLYGRYNEQNATSRHA